MQKKLDRDVRPRDRAIDKRVITMGALAFLGIAICCLIGFFISSKMRPSTSANQQMNQMAGNPMPGGLPQQPAQVEPTPEIKVTEHPTPAPTVTPSPAPQDGGVTQDGNGLTITLDPSDQNPDSASDQTQQDAQTPPPPPPPAPPVHPRSETAVKKDPVSHSEVITPSTPPGDREKKPSGSSRGTYRVQAGTFANRANADSLADDLRGKGYRADVKVVNVEDHTLYRVQLGGYRLRDDAQELANDLSAEGYSPTVINDRN